MRSPKPSLKTPIARPLERDIWCLLWVQTLLYILLHPLQWYMQCHIISDRVITAPTVSQMYDFYLTHMRQRQMDYSINYSSRSIEYQCMVTDNEIYHIPRLYKMAYLNTVYLMVLHHIFMSNSISPTWLWNSILNLSPRGSVSTKKHKIPT